jgi:uncharacterized protein YndB with AHSA1/START domain
MTRIFTTIHISCPINQVFEYLTTPDKWSEWHPSVHFVKGATDHSLKVGEQVTENYSQAWCRRCVVWTVVEREELRRWIIDGIDSEGNDAGRVAFTFKQATNGTLFEREFTYQISNIFSAFLDWLIFCPRKKAESAEALRRLKEHLEKTCSSERQEDVRQLKNF